MAEKLDRPCSSRAQTSPSSTQSGVLTAFSTALATVAKRWVKSFRLRLSSRAAPPPPARGARRRASADVRGRPVPVPLVLEQPAVAFRNTLRQGRKHRRVLGLRAGRRGIV